MKSIFRILLLPLCAGLGLSQPVAASVIFKPGEKTRVPSAPGERKSCSGTAQQLLAKAQQLEKEGNTKGAIKVYRTLVKRHPHDALASGALYRMAQLQEQNHYYSRAAESYIVLVGNFPRATSSMLRSNHCFGLARCFWPVRR